MGLDTSILTGSKSRILLENTPEMLRDNLVDRSIKLCVLLGGPLTRSLTFGLLGVLAVKLWGGPCRLGNLTLGALLPVVLILGFSSSMEWDSGLMLSSPLPTPVALRASGEKEEEAGRLGGMILDERENKNDMKLSRLSDKSLEG